MSNGGLTAEPALRSARMRSSEDGCARPGAKRDQPAADAPLAGRRMDATCTQRTARSAGQHQQVAQSDADASAGPRVRTHLRTTARRTMQPRGPAAPSKPARPRAHTPRADRSPRIGRPGTQGAPGAGAALAATARRLGRGGGLAAGRASDGGSAAAPRPRRPAPICTMVTENQMPSTPATRAMPNTTSTTSTASPYTMALEAHGVVRRIEIRRGSVREAVEHVRKARRRAVRTPR